MYPESTTYAGCLNFLQYLMDSEIIRILKHLHRTVYTNANLIRTPDESKEHLQAIAPYKEISRFYLNKIIEFSEPELILCFGNNETGATESLFKVCLKTHPLKWHLTCVAEE